MMNMNLGRARNAAFEEICMISFAIDELRLYLDTHPGCAEALSLIKEYMRRRRELLDSYTDKYGSIEAYSIGDEESWMWNYGYMPWNGMEGDC